MDRLLKRNADGLGPVQRASDEELVRARTVLLGLRWFYGLYMMRGLFNTGHTGARRVAGAIDAWGMFPVLGHIISVSPSPRQFAEGLTVCLEPLFDGLYEALTE